MGIAISVDEPDIVSASIGQEPGAVYPSFSFKKFPHQAKPEDLEQWLEYDPPDLDINVGGTVWTCQCTSLRTTGSRESGIELDLQYVPKPFAVLQHSGYSKQLVFLSCPQWQKDLYTANLDEDVTKLYWKNSDPYISNGWTVNEIFTEIGELAGVTMTSKLPTLHVGNATVICNKGQQYLPFLLSLLPTNGFTYAWFSHDNTLTVALIEPATQAFRVPADAVTLELGKDKTPTYDLIEITGGLYKPTFPLTLGSQNLGSGSTSGRCNTTLTETLPDEPRDVGGYTQTTARTRTIRTDEEGNPFAILEEIEQVHGPIFNLYGNLASTGVIRHTSTSHTYDNHDAHVYQVPRLVHTERSVSGFVYEYVLGRSAVSSGKLYYLTEDLAIITEEQYRVMDPAPTVILSAKVSWKNAYETHIEDKVYTQTTEVTQDWPEGSEREHVQDIQRMMYRLDNSIWIDCTEDPQTALGRVIQAKSQDETPTVTVKETSVKQARLLENRVVLKSPKTYEFQSRESRWNPQTGKLEHDAQQTPIDSDRIPSQPTQFRLKPLKATAGDLGGNTGKTITPVSASIPTNNPHDFEYWAGLLYWQLTHPKRAVSVQSTNSFLPPGYRYAHGTIVGFQIQQQGQEQTVRYAIE
jgi:hypothetical protein